MRPRCAACRAACMWGGELVAQQPKALAAPKVSRRETLAIAAIAAAEAADRADRA
jgi:hypothetical protein